MDAEKPLFLGGGMLLSGCVRTGCGALWARDFVPLLTPDLRPGLHYVAPPELNCGGSIREHADELQLL